MKKLLIIIILSSVFSISSIGQSMVVTPTYSPFSFSDIATPLIIATEVHREVENRINNLKLYIIDALSKDIDDKLKNELNNEYARLRRLSENLNRNGVSQSIIHEFNSIYNDINSHIVSYNNRVEQRKREYEREQRRIAEEQKRIAEEQERQRKIEESQPKVWSGTGFALNNGYLVTNWHVADEAQTIHVYGVRGDFKKKYIAEVVTRDKINDLAILKISGNGFPGFGTVPYIVKTSTAEVAEDVWVLGFPLTMIMGDEIKYTDGRISALSGIDGDVSLYQISAPIQSGNSGGPVFDDSGNVIGIACAGIDNRLAQNANYAVKSSYLKNLVDAMQFTNVLPTASQMANYPRRQDKVKAVRNFVFYIECCDKELSLDGVANRPSYIDVSPTSLYFSEMKESKTLVISTNAPSWKIKSKPNWCTATGKTATSVTINVTKNESYESRNGNIELETNDGKSVSVYISQAGKERPYITANPKSIDFDYNSGRKSISVSTNSESWVIASKPNWCTTDKTTTSVTINVTKNESYETRNGTVKLETNDGESVSIYVSQSGKERPYITISPTRISFSDTREERKISISTNSDSWKVSSKPDWCNVRISSDYETLTIEAIKNNSYDIRNGTIVLETNDGASVSLSVSQSGKERPYITANPKSISFDEHEGQKTISVKTNSESWNVSSTPNWCTISDRFSSSIVIKAKKNKSHKNRVGAIELVTNDGAKSYINMFQGGKPSVTVGLNFGIGYQSNNAFKSLTGSVGLDMVWGRNNAYGLFLSYRTMDNISVGPLFVFGNFILGAGVNLNVGRNIKSGLPASVQSRRLNMGCDGILRLGVKLGKKMYLFVEGGAGKINGVDYLCNESAQSTTEIKWSRNNGTISLGLGIRLNDGNKNVWSWN
ncbi:MAG: trypsin-like peptidase domain-containing protein [Bacteroidales bacterium]|nr:trypsin-like peptidase domain-containing protein [Bacteroidales bacterium]